MVQKTTSVQKEKQSWNLTASVQKEIAAMDRCEDISGYTSVEQRGCRLYQKIRLSDTT